MKLKQILQTLSFVFPVGALGFGWMYCFLAIVSSLSPAVLIITAMLSGPLCAIGFTIFLTSRGENTLVELAIWFSLPCGFLVALFLLERWASLALVWDILLAIVLAVPAGLLSIALISLILAPLAFVIGRLVGISESNKNESIS